MEDFARPADLAAFLRALELSADREDGIGTGIDAGNIALVESAWQIPDTVVSSYGWVMLLEDGRRLYLEYTLDDSRYETVEEEIDIRELRPDESYPALDDDTGVFWYRPDHINAHLGVAGRALH